jgi:hypothetical protein
MSTMKIMELKKRIVNLIEMERVVANKTLREAQKKNDNDVLIIAQSYLMGLKRIQMILNNLFREMK